MAAPATFGFDEFMCAVDNERRTQGLTWYELAARLWDQSAELNGHRSDHPL